MTGRKESPDKPLKRKILMFPDESNNTHSVLKNGNNKTGKKYYYYVR